MKGMTKLLFLFIIIFSCGRVYADITEDDMRDAVVEIM